MMIHLVSSGTYLEILRNMWRMWKHDEVMALSWDFMVRIVSRMRSWFLAWSVGVAVGPSSAGHLVESQGEPLFPKISTSVLSVLNLRQFIFIQLATLVMHSLTWW